MGKRDKEIRQDSEGSAYRYDFNFLQMFLMKKSLKPIASDKRLILFLYNFLTFFTLYP